MGYYWFNKEIYFHSVNNEKQMLKFSDVVVNKKENYASKQAIPLNSINANNIVISYRIKQNDDGFRYFIGHCN